jgi:AcrR family transcriptional regulator
MAFGKRGRPAEDLLVRQREIYEAVSPLILQMGVQQLSMRQAASAACLSVGGLYHHFSTKRELVLFGLEPAALRRRCSDFETRFGYLVDVDPGGYLECCVENNVELIRFIRPAIHAALELGVDTFWYVIDAVLTLVVQDFTVALQRIFPKAEETARERIGRSIRRSLAGGVLDKTVSDDEIRDELHALIEGYRVRARQELQPIPTPVLMNGATGAKG